MAARYAAAGAYPLDVVAPLKLQAQSLDVWNLFLAGLRDNEPGTRLTNLECARWPRSWGDWPGPARSGLTHVKSGVVLR